MQFLKLSTELITDTNITSNEFRIYTYLLSLYSQEKQCSYPSIDVISERLNISIATVKRSIKKLSELGYITIEKRKGLAGNFNVYRKLKHLISNVVIKKNANKDTKVRVNSNGGKPIDGQISVEDALQDIEEVQSETINRLDNSTNVRLARSVTNIDNSNFAKKVLSLADKDIVRDTIKDFKNKRGKTPTFLIKLLVDQYYKAGINLSKPLLNLLKKDYVLI
ncbi:helix-turn-helix domain-containing protein [Clostridium sp.]|uniref:helix-turn-helix domain-containing protein n=1 Tax=Clostridium sp. TaxID=1506 RepID=UPI0028FE4F3C|nr:helix-turn-helix domain-containing protein [Clostridium sp.]MDU2155771.1 helix-turn-helix domain-containing protein [Clostridium sp.]